jgi:hypothetical protein
MFTIEHKLYTSSDSAPPPPPASQGKILGAYLARGAAAPGGRFQETATLNKMNTSYGNIPSFALSTFLNYWDK